MLNPSDELNQVEGRLLELAASAADIREANIVIQGIEASGRILKTIIEAQRRAFGLDDPGATAGLTPKPPPEMSKVAPEDAGEVYLRWANGSR